MRSEELILAVILALIIVSDFRYPDSVNKFIKNPIGMLLVLGLVLYLFTKSSILGILGLIAGFLMVQRAGSFTPKYGNNTSPFPMLNNDPPMATSVSLEETIIQNIMPVTNSPGTATFGNMFSDVGNAADAFS